jgi:uncharacterized protein YhbP (UPF0306 family)
MERKVDPVELKSSIEELLHLTTMTLATIGLDGEPHAAAVYFACDDQINFYFFSDAESQHALDNTNEPRAAITVNGEGGGWQEIYGLQLRGAITAVQSKNEWQGAWDHYQTKFPFVSNLQEIIVINQMYVFKPHWIRLIDNRKGFGFKQEWGKSPAEKMAEDVPAWTLLTYHQGISGSTNG